MKKKRNQVLLFLGFAGPAILAFVFVIGWAFVNGVFMSFTDWNGISEHFNVVGLSNYVKAFHDVNFWESLVRTFKYAIGVVLAVNILAFLLAYLLTKGYRGQGVYRTGFFIPNLIGGVVLGIVWKFIFSEALVQLGQIPLFGTFAGNWLSDPNTAMLAMIIVAVWQMAGYLMIIYMAGIIAVPKDVCEAASLDGASGFYAIRKIILPLIMPSITICSFLSIKAAFMVYDVNLTLTAGGPYKSTIMASMHVYNKAFKYNDFGIGQAEALILFLIVAVITVIQVTVTKKKEVEA
ncbi:MULTISPECIES: carbohydrate ABC transporter permease [Blautia]|uniref:Sugar ABC transporter permease n=1 Tax=Blautia hominis TaxID=2025493 RepID=A0ABQ0BDR0_9FIRM|nr:sugar ABC transporter permease [Blautia marasmi]